MASLQATAALAGAEISGRAVRLGPVEGLRLSHVKARRLAADWLAPDATPGQEVGGIIWLGPNERLLVNQLAPELPGDVSVTDVSHQFVTIGIEGGNTQRLFETGTAAFPTVQGGATRLRFGDITAIVRKLGDNDAQLMVDSSISRWLWDWLANRVEQLGL